MKTTRRRSAALALGLAAVLGMSLAGAASAAPAPSFSATVTADRACLLTVNAAWKNAKVDHVYFIWYQDEGYIATSEAPGLYGSLRGRTATSALGPVTAGATSHTWRVLVQLYSGGAFVADVNPTVTTTCGLG